MTHVPAEALPSCEGWTCQSCGADNFIPAGFARVASPDEPPEELKPTMTRPAPGEPGYDDFARLSNDIADAPGPFVTLTAREAIAAHLWSLGYRRTDVRTDDHAPCCTACGGKGGTVSGPCWDCRGTGHPHPVDG